MNYLLGTEAPPYIIIGISITLIAAILGIIHQYRTSHVDIYEVKFGGIFKLSHCIKFLMLVAISFLTLSLLNIIVALEGEMKEYFQALIKITLTISAYSYMLLMFEYYIRLKEELVARR